MASSDLHGPLRLVAALLMIAAPFGCDTTLPAPRLSGDGAPCLPPWTQADTLRVDNDCFPGICRVALRAGPGCTANLTLTGCASRPLQLQLDFPAGGGDPRVTRTDAPNCSLEAPRPGDALRLECPAVGARTCRLSIAADPPAPGRVIRTSALVDPPPTLTLPYGLSSITTSAFALHSGFLGGSVLLDDTVWVAAYRGVFVDHCVDRTPTQLHALGPRPQVVEFAECLDVLAPDPGRDGFLASFVAADRIFIGRHDGASGARTASAALARDLRPSDGWGVVALSPTPSAVYVALGLAREQRRDRASRYLRLDPASLAVVADSGEVLEETLTLVGDRESVLILTRSPPRLSRRGPDLQVTGERPFAPSERSLDALGALAAGSFGGDAVIALELGGVAVLPVGLAVDGSATWSTALASRPAQLSWALAQLDDARLLLGLNSPLEVNSAGVIQSLEARLARVDRRPLRVQPGELVVGQGLIGAIHPLGPTRALVTLPWTGTYALVELEP